jgi:hypothetical protein
LFIDGVTIFQVVSFSLFQYEVGVASNDMRSIPDLVTVGSKSSNMIRSDAHNNNNDDEDDIIIIIIIIIIILSDYQ